jgi:hypothetical protein
LAIPIQCYHKKFEFKGITTICRRYTWANNLPVPTFEKLDRILVDIDWEVKYPKVSVHAFTRDISDHTPLLLDTRDSCPATQNHMFKFELSWLIREDFYGIVKKIWQQETKGS